MKILVTGSAGFIGSELSMKLLERGDVVIGVDNHNDYYNPSLKEARLARHINHPNYIHVRQDISNLNALSKVFDDYKPRRVVNLAAQAGVRYSIENPQAYTQSNIVGFLNILECCKTKNIEHLIFASSSSVYGANTSLPLSVTDNVDHPLSIYAASKKTNELMAHSYSYLYGLPTTGLRFFTVYGPWGRPDMAPYKFVNAIINGEKIKVYNYGNHKRDFTYVDDIVEGIMLVIDNPAKANLKWTGKSPDPSTSSSPWKIYNMGNNCPVNLMDFIKTIEETTGLKANIEMLPMQPGDVADTFANIDSLISDFGCKPKTNIVNGVNKLVKWYNEYHKTVPFQS